MDQKFACKYCNKKFHKENTLLTHFCVKKRRFMDAEATGPKIGFRVFQKFYQMSSSSKTVKTLDDFINSDYYIGFVKFGNHIALLKPLHSEKFIEYVIKNAIPLNKWTRDEVYYSYLIYLMKTEPGESATTRTLENIIQWCDDNNVNFCDFFSKISPYQAASMIQLAKISPWVLYLSVTGDALMERFTEDHFKIIKDIIDTSYWAVKFKKEVDEVKFIKKILKEANI